MLLSTLQLQSLKISTRETFLRNTFITHTRVAFSLPPSLHCFVPTRAAKKQRLFVKLQRGINKPSHCQTFLMSPYRNIHIHITRSLSACRVNKEPG